MIEECPGLKSVNYFNIFPLYKINDMDKVFLLVKEQ